MKLIKSGIKDFPIFYKILFKENNFKRLTITIAQTLFLCFYLWVAKRMKKLLIPRNLFNSNISGLFSKLYFVSNLYHKTLIKYEENPLIKIFESIYQDVQESDNVTLG